MNLEDAKEKFKMEYSRPWFELVEESQDELVFGARGGVRVKVSSEDLNGYLEFEARRGQFENKPFETCLCSPTHYEQLITSTNRFSPFLAMRRSEGLTFGDPTVDRLVVEVSDASLDYKNYFRFHEYFVIRTLDRTRISRGQMREGRELSDFLYMPMTIKVLGLRETTAESSAKRSLELIEGCLFNLSYLKGYPLVLEEEYPKRHAIGAEFRYEEREIGSQLPLPKAKINGEVVRFYQRGMAIEDPVNQYLSFYQVLEYFFLAVSDEELYRKLSSVMNDPLFSAKPKHLDKVIQATLNHKRESDETEMLRLVLTKYIDEAEIISFIEAYEKHLADKWFTKKRRVFGEDNEVRATIGHVIGNVAKRVKLIRNALVHSSDRYNRQEKFLPTRAAEAEIRKEVPLVKFLAEKAIIASSN